MVPQVPRYGTSTPVQRTKLVDNRYGTRYWVPGNKYWYHVQVKDTCTRYIVPGTYQKLVVRYQVHVPGTHYAT